MPDPSPPPDFHQAIQSTLSHTASYAADPAFAHYWTGFTEESRNYKAQQVRAFGELVGAAHHTLEGQQILDVGCGNGHWLRAYVEYGARPEDVVGIDVSDARFATGRARNPLIRMLKTDGATLPFEAGRFDLVTQNVCFSNIPTPALRRQVAAEIRRVLKPGGHLYWWDLNRTTAPDDYQQPLDPADYFPWPARRLAVGWLPRPAECLRRLGGLRRFLVPFVDFLGYPPTHVAALIGPKPTE